MTARGEEDEEEGAVRHRERRDRAHGRRPASKRALPEPLNSICKGLAPPLECPNPEPGRTQHGVGARCCGPESCHEERDGPDKPADPEQPVE